MWSLCTEIEVPGVRRNPFQTLKSLAGLCCYFLLSFAACEGKMTLQRA